MFANKSPHKRYGQFLKVYSFFWAFFFILTLAQLAASIVDQNQGAKWSHSLAGAAVTLLFFLLYFKTASILNSYTDEEAARFRYLKYLTPIAPVIYISTGLLLVIAIINIVMLGLYAIGALVFLLGILVTFGLVLLADDYRLKNFISVPESFFRTEKIIFGEYLHPGILVAFIIIIYFVIPVSSCLVIIYQHMFANPLPVKAE